MQFTTRDVRRIIILSLVTVITLTYLFLSSASAETKPDSNALPEVEVMNFEATVEEVVYFLIVEQQRIISDYVNAIAEAERLAAIQAYEDAQISQKSNSTSTTRSGQVGSTVGECSGFVIPDYIIQAESGGNPSAYNPSGAYGCAQTLLSHYSGGSCSGLDPYSIEGQRECVNILSNGGTNLDPWAQTR